LLMHTTRNKLKSLLLLSFSLPFFICLGRCSGIHLLSLFRFFASSHHLRLRPLLAYLDDGRHVPELVSVLHGLSEVFVHLDLLSLLFLKLLQLYSYLLLLLGLLKLLQEIFEEFLELLDVIQVKDRGSYQFLIRDLWVYELIVVMKFLDQCSPECLNGLLKRLSCLSIILRLLMTAADCEKRAGQQPLIANWELHAIIHCFLVRVNRTSYIFLEQDYVTESNVSID